VTSAMRPRERVHASDTGLGRTVPHSIDAVTYCVTPRAVSSYDVAARRYSACHAITQRANAVTQRATLSNNRTLIRTSTVRA
jgi:hypothetical protein